MQKRIIGRTGLSVTPVGYGAMELRLLEDPGAADRILNAVLDTGINYVDTSPDYLGSEELIGKFIAHRRHEYFLATKCGCHVETGGQPLDPPHVWSRAQLLRNIETSLRLLKTDTIDLWQLHGPSPAELPGGPQDEVIRTLEEVKRSGKVRFIGMSFKNGRATEELYPAGYGTQYIRTFVPWNVFDVMQIVYGGLTRQNEKRITEATQAGIGMVIRGVIKRYFPDYDECFTRAGLDELREPGEDRNAFLIRFALNHAGIGTLIIGSKDPGHIQANVTAAAKGPLPSDIYEEAKRRLDQAGIVAAE